MASTYLRAAPGPGGFCTSTPCGGCAQETYRNTLTIPATWSVDSGFAGWAPSGLPVGRPVGQSDQITAHAEEHPGTIKHSPTTATPGSSTRKREHAETVRRPKPPPKPNISVRNPHLAFIQTPWQPWQCMKRNLLWRSLPVNSWNLCHRRLKVRSPHH